MEYFAPDTENEVHSLLSELKDKAVLVAGGVFFMAHREELFSEAEAIIDLKKLGLNYIEADDGALRVGATTTLTQVMKSELTRKGIFGVLSEAVSQIRPNEIRNMGTVGGNLCISGEVDMPTPLIALDGKVVIASATESRGLPLDEFYLGYLKNALKPDEIVREVKIPRFPPRTGAGFYKFGRTGVDLPIVNAAARITLVDHDRCGDVKIVLGSISETPFRAVMAEKKLLGNKLSDEFIARVAAESASEIECITDQHATAELRQRLAKVALRSVIDEANKRAKRER